MGFSSFTDERILKLLDEGDTFEKFINFNIIEDTKRVEQWKRDIKEYRMRIERCEWLIEHTEKGLVDFKGTQERIELLKQTMKE